MIPDPSRGLDTCPLVIFIAYTVGPEAEANGYSEWLRRVDMPFFNAIPGTRHYANWRISAVLHGKAPPWDYFDFQGLTSDDDLRRVWFNRDLDAFRTEWIRLWGYGSGEPPPVLRHAYLMRRVQPPSGRAKDRILTLAGGRGAAPADAGSDLLFQVEDILHKHFGGVDTDRPWKSPVAEGNPLGLDWLSVSYGSAAPAARSGTDLLARATLIAAPDLATDA